MRDSLSLPAVDAASSSSKLHHVAVAAAIAPGPAAAAATPAPVDSGHGQVKAAAYDPVPKSCPHCGSLVSAAGTTDTTLTCYNCHFTFLNVSPEKLQLGTTVLLEKMNQGKVNNTTAVLLPQQQQQQHVASSIETSAAAISGTAINSHSRPVKRAAVAVQQQELGRHRAQPNWIQGNGGRDVDGGSSSSSSTGHGNGGGSSSSSQHTAEPGSLAASPHRQYRLGSADHAAVHWQQQ